MAYLSTEKKKELDLQIKAIAKEYGLKISTINRHHMEYDLTILEGDIDFGDKGVNIYYLEEMFTGKALEVLMKFRDVLFGNGYFDESDPMTDYFHCAWYVDINIGRWDKPYVLKTITRIDDLHIIDTKSGKVVTDVYKETIK